MSDTQKPKTVMPDDKFRARPYDLSSPAEHKRLWRECSGYLHTCERHHHGTDFEGRKYARNALEELIVSGARTETPEVEALVKAAERAERSMALLGENSRQCILLHHNADIASEGWPGWLRDTEADLIAFRAALLPFKGA